MVISGHGFAEKPHRRRPVAIVACAEYVPPEMLAREDYENACAAFLYACFNGFRGDIIRARADRLRAAKLTMEGKS